MAVTGIQIAPTKEGLETLANYVATATAFSVSFFRLTDNGDDTTFNGKKVYHVLSDETTSCTFYMNYSASDFETDYPVGSSHLVNLSTLGLTNSEGYFTINSLQVIANFTVEIDCYIPPMAGSQFTASEIMIYTGTGTIDDPYKSFMWGIFPSITKLDGYGLNFKVLLQF
jgi:hypothetical protein